MMREEQYRLAMICLDRIEAAMDTIAQAYGYASMNAYLDAHRLNDTLPKAA